jgi:hypothetical protein
MTAGHVERVEEMINEYRNMVGKPEETRLLERIILKWILGK